LLDLADSGDIKATGCIFTLADLRVNGAFDVVARRGSEALMDQYSMEAIELVVGFRVAYCVFRELFAGERKPRPTRSLPSSTGPSTPPTLASATTSNAPLTRKIRQREYATRGLDVAAVRRSSKPTLLSRR